MMTEPLKVRVNKTTLYIATAFLGSVAFYSKGLAFLHCNHCEQVYRLLPFQWQTHPHTELQYFCIDLTGISGGLLLE